MPDYVENGFLKNEAGALIISGGGGGGTAVRTGSTVSELDAAGTPADGDIGVLTVGTYPDQQSVHLRWSADANRWIGDAVTLVTQGDTWAMDLGDRSGTELLDWSPIDNALPFGKSHAFLTGAHNLSAANFNPGTATGVITVNDTASTHSFPFQSSSDGSPYLQIRDNYITYTGLTATTFTGCAVVQGSRGTIPDAEWAVQGYPGGWGFEADSVPFADQLYAAGLQLQERLTSLMNSAPGEKKLTIAPYWREYDPGDGALPVAIPPAGGLGVGVNLTSLDLTGGSVGAERTFYLTGANAGWTDWSLTAPTKKFLIPRIVGKMEAGATLSGSCLDTKLMVRWVS